MIRDLPFGRPLIGVEEKSAVLDVLDSPILVHGPKAMQFENDFAAFVNAPHAISVSSCTAGMHLVWFTLGLKSGDEVIVPAMTHTATAHAVALTGARPVFVDAEKETGNIDITAIEAAISPRTKGIVVVHYLGMPVAMKEVIQLASKYKLFLMEDCALSPGACLNGIHTGLHGDCGVFSFYPVKHMTTAEGGIIILKDESLAKELRLKKAFGVDRSHGERRLPGMYDVVELGFNYRMSEIHAAIGIEQLKKLPKFIENRRINYEKLSQNIKNIEGVKLLSSTDAARKSSYYCLNVMLSSELAIRRSEIMSHLGERGIGTSIYYPQPVPRMTYYAKKYGWSQNNYPNAEWIADNSIALSVAPHLTEDDMQYIANNLESTIGGLYL